MIKKRWDLLILILYLDLRFPAHQEREERMRDMHREDMSGQSLAHRAAMDVMRTEAENARQAALDTQADKSREQMGVYWRIVCGPRRVPGNEVFVTSFFLCVFVYVCACVRVCVHACVCVCVHGCMFACETVLYKC